MTRSPVRRLRCERGDALIEGILALGLVLLVVAFAGQAIAYVHARNVAEAAAQDGVSAAASQGPQAGIARAQTILGAAGGAGAALQATATETSSEVTVTVHGQAPKLFSLPLVLPGIQVEASLPLEQYPSDDQAAAP
jgi:hypothetical protein